MRIGVAAEGTTKETFPAFPAATRGPELPTHMRTLLPLTANAAAWLEAPALFDAVQVYSPACLVATASISSTLSRLFFVIVY